MSDRAVSVERVIQADPATIFAIISDPQMHPVMDGSGMLTGTLVGPSVLTKGSKFGMRMKLKGLPYVIRNVVVEHEPDRRLAWRHLFRHVWRYELEPVDGGGTLVRETFDYAPSVYPRVLEHLDVPKAHRKNITRTLENLDRLACERQAELDGDVAG